MQRKKQSRFWGRITTRDKSRVQQREIGFCQNVSVRANSVELKRSFTKEDGGSCVRAAGLDRGPSCRQVIAPLWLNFQSFFIFVLTRCFKGRHRVGIVMFVCYRVPLALFAPRRLLRLRYPTPAKTPFLTYNSNLLHTLDDDECRFSHM